MQTARCASVFRSLISARLNPQLEVARTSSIVRMIRNIDAEFDFLLASGIEALAVGCPQLATAHEDNHRAIGSVGEWSTGLGSLGLTHRPSAVAVLDEASVLVHGELPLDPVRVDEVLMADARSHHAV